MKFFLPILFLSLLSTSCGKKGSASLEAAKGSIVGGREVEFSNNDDISASTAFFKNKDGSTCSGVLITNRAILTAAHCFEKSAPTEVYIGRIDNDPNKDPLTRYFVNKTIIHELYKPGVLAHDLALIILEKEIVFPGRPVKIFEASYELQAGTPLTVTGFSPFAKNQKWDFFDIFDTQITSLYNQDERKLRKQDVAFINYKTPNRISFAQFWGGICSGDSGGPTFIMHNRTPYLFAINSSVSSSDDKKFSDCEMLGSSTIVAPYRSWIEAKIKGSAPKFENIQDQLDPEGANCGSFVLEATEAFAEQYKNKTCENSEAVRDYLQDLVDGCRIACHKNVSELGQRCRYMELGIKRFVQRASSNCR